MPELSAASRLALAASCVAAVAFVVSIAYMPYPGAVLLKVVPIIALMVLSWQSLAGRTRPAVLAALTASAVGDITLELGAFLPGLSAFLAAQLVYAGIFFGQREITGRSLTQAGLVACLVAAAGASIWPHAGDMQVPVTFYMTAIGIMGLAAALHALPSVLILAGAISFIVSDSLIGYNRFVQPLAGAREWIMVTYYLAQILLVCGIVRYDFRSKLI